MIKKDSTKIKEEQINKILKKLAQKDLAQKDYPQTKEEKINKNKFKIYQSEYLNKCKDYVFNKGCIWWHVYISVFMSSFKETNFHFYDKLYYIESKDLFRKYNESSDFKSNVWDPEKNLSKKKITKNTKLEFISSYKKPSKVLASEISLVTKYAVYSAFITLGTMLLFWNDAVISFLDFVFQNKELSPRFWVSSFTKPIHDKIKFCIYLTVPFLWMTIMQLGLIFIGPGLWLFEKKKIFTIIFINIFLYLFMFLLVTGFLYPKTVEIFTEMFFSDITYNISTYKDLEESLRIRGIAELQPSYEDLIAPYYKMLITCWCVLAMPVNAVIILFLKMKRTFEFDVTKPKRSVSWSILGMASAFVSPPDLPYQIILTFYFITVYESIVAAVFILSEIILIIS